LLTRRGIEVRLSMGGAALACEWGLHWRVLEQRRLELTLIAFVIHASSFRTSLSTVGAWLVRNLPGTGSKTCAFGVTGRIESPEFTAAAQQIAGKRAPTVFAAFDRASIVCPPPWRSYRGRGTPRPSGSAENISTDHRPAFAQPAQATPPFPLFMQRLRLSTLIDISNGVDRIVPIERVSAWGDLSKPHLKTEPWTL